MASNPSSRTVAVTAIEYRDIVVTVASLAREPESSSLSVPPGPFITMILGGPLAGQAWENMTWSEMILNHAGAVGRVAELVAEQTEQSDERQ